MTGLIEGKEYHCGRIARSLRDSHRALLLGAGLDIHRELRTAFDASSWRRALVIKGEVLALTGLVGTMASAEAMIWLALSGEAYRTPITVARTALVELREIMATKRRVTTTVLKGDSASVRFAYFLGFRASASTEVNGMDAMVMAFDAKGMA